MHLICFERVQSKQTKNSKSKALHRWNMLVLSPLTSSDET